MHTQSEATKFTLQKMGSYIFNIGLLTGMTTLAFGLVSCGGSGDSSPPPAGSTTPTITDITPSGIVASSVSRTLSIKGTNFVNGMNLSITNSSAVAYTITSSSVTSATVLTANVTITPASAPLDNYVTFAIKSGTTTLVSAVLGVAGTEKKVSTGIQTIFNNKCSSCHTGTGSGGLDLTDATSGNPSTGLIGIKSKGCTSRLRTTPGDPRRTSSVLIDKIKATSLSPACFGTPMPPSGSTALTTQEIQDLVDWVAGGTY